MNLTKDEIDKMSFLLGKSKYFILNIEECNELRTLINKELPCPLNFDKMIKSGLIIVGTYTILEAYEKMKNIEE